MTISRDLSEIRLPLKPEFGGVAKDYISGLQVNCFDGAALTVSPGFAFIPSLGYALEVTSTLTLNLTGTTAGVWYSLYLYNNNGVPAIELVTTAPSSPYAGTARTKTGDTSRRLLGMYRSNTTGGVWPFMATGNDRIQYNLDWANGGFRVLAAGTASVRTSIDIANVVPVIGVAVLLALTHAGTTAAQVFSITPDGVTALVSGVTVQPGGKMVVEVPHRGLKVSYSWNTPPQGGSTAFVDVGGYSFVR